MLSSRSYQWVSESTADLHQHPDKFEVAREGIVESVLESDTQNGIDALCKSNTSLTGGRGGSRHGCGRKPMPLARLKRPDLARPTISKRPD